MRASPMTCCQCPCRTLFVEAEGLELMVLILKQRQQVRFGALKAVVGIQSDSTLILTSSCIHSVRSVQDLDV